MDNHFYQHADVYLDLTREALQEGLKKKLEKKNLKKEETISRYKSLLENPDQIEALLAHRAFDLRDDDTEEGDCILIMGLNPAGGKKDADREKDMQHHNYYCFGGKNKKGEAEWHYNRYYKPILDCMSLLCMEGFDGVKWPWCNYEWSEIEDEVDNDPGLREQKELIQKFYEHRCKNNCTIYMGDMYYYHETDSRKLPVVPNHQYCEKMLKLHLKALREHHKRVRFVYINNAKISSVMYGNKIKIEKLDANQEIDGVKVFFGGMLSGGHAMDISSKSRLIGEIRNWLAGESGS